MCGKWRCSFQLQPIEWVKGKVIGSGSFGTVHLAMDNATGSLFVAKSTISESGILSLKNEANILDNLDSPYVIKCIGKDFSLATNGEKKHTLFLEYMAGGSLSDVAEKFGGTLDERVIRLYTREILRGLKYLHQNGIVHSDLKCKNVLLGLSGNIKLADFGAAKKIYDGKKNVKTSMKSWDSCLGGTPLWMAPEVLRNEGLDFSSDIWSLGCTVIEMATGKPGWDIDRSNPMDGILKISRGDKVPQFPGDFSKEGLDFLEKCLQTDPRKRWTSQELLEHPFVDMRLGNLFSRKADAFSPSSVLDVGSYESDDSDDDECSGGSTPFSGRLKKMVARDVSGRGFESSGDWITVRKR